MKLKEMLMKLIMILKNFFTLDVHNHAGFTLVELIIVIAIIAILSSVAVAGYSSYIKKANKQADMTLVSEIENALMLAYYSGELSNGGVVVLSVDDVAKADGLEDVMKNAFGDNWQNTLKLKYTGWKGSSAYTVSQNWNDSTYSDNQQQLLTDVQQLTNALETFVATSGTQFIGQDYMTFADQYGIDVTDSTQVANAASLYVAEQTKKVNVDEFVKAWTRNSGASADLSNNNFTKSEVGSLGIMGSLAAHYARAESLAAYVDANYSSEVNFTNDAGEKITASQWLSAKQINGADTDAVVASMATITNQFAQCLGANYQDIIKAYGASPKASADAKAYVSMMGAIVENSDSLLEGVDKDGTLYTDGTVNQLLNNYMAAGAALKDCPEGSIAVVISADENGYSIMVVGMGE